MRVERFDGATLYQADCFDVLPGLPAVNAVVTDPPYGIKTRMSAPDRIPARNRHKKLHYGTPRWREWPGVTGDNQPFDPAPWLSFPTVVLFGANHFSDRLPPATRWLIWDKRRGNTSDDNADCEIAWSNASGPARLYSHLWRGFVRDSECGEARLHPTQKPVAVMEWVLRETTKPGDLVLDPYMGSASTGVACMRQGRAFIGVEILPAYFETACRRMETAARARNEAQRQGNLLAAD